MSEEKDRVDGTADETKAETKSSDHHTEDTYEKVCFMCRRPESKAGKMITLPGNINICPDCMQKSFDTMKQNPGQINEMMNNMNNMPNIGMFASFDPLALDQACVDACMAANPMPNSQLSDNMKKPGFADWGDPFRNSTPESEWRSCLEHAEKIGLGTREYELIKM